MKPDTKPNTIVSTTFHKFSGGVVIDIPCIIDNHTLFNKDIYTLLDFGDNCSIVEHPAVRFFDAYLEGYVVTIVVLDLKTGELLKRKHRINDEDLPCNWVLMRAGYLEPEDRRDDLLQFDF
jgi:hypothetical protein